MEGMEGNLRHARPQCRRSPNGPDSPDLAMQRMKPAVLTLFNETKNAELYLCCVRWSRKWEMMVAEQNSAQGNYLKGYRMTLGYVEARQCALVVPRRIIVLFVEAFLKASPLPPTPFAVASLMVAGLAARLAGIFQPMGVICHALCVCFVLGRSWDDPGTMKNSFSYPFPGCF